MSHRFPALILLLAALLCAPATVQAGPADRIEKLGADGKHDEAVSAARKWLERNPEHADVERVKAQLAESEYQRVLAAPSLGRTAAWREEFGEGARRKDLDSLEANLRLYAAAEVGTEAAYLEIVEGWAGTAAAREALLRAEEAAFLAAKADGSAGALSTFLGDYRDLPHQDEATELWRGAAWTEAEASDRADDWQRLRMQDPDHPRAEEALLNEQTRALAELGPDGSPGDLLRLARRYAQGPAGWEAMQRATDHAVLRGLDEAGAVLFEEVLGPGLGPAAAPIELPAAARIDLVHDGRLPKGVSIAVQVFATIEEKDSSWLRATFRQAARWGVRSDPPQGDPEQTAAFTTDRPLCRGDLLDAGALIVTVGLGDQEASWRRPATFSSPCVGPLPWAVQRKDGLAVRLRSGAEEQALGGAMAGVQWPCDGPLLPNAGGVGGTCGGWRWQPFSGGTLVAVPRGSAAYEDEASPWLDELPGSGWAAVDVPDGWHFGGAPRCPLRDTAQAAPPVPSWVPEEGREQRDADGDGAPDLVVAQGSAGTGTLIFIGGPLPPAAGWATAWAPGVDPARARLVRDGCSLRWEQE